MKQFLKVSRAIFKNVFKLDVRHFIGTEVHKPTVHFLAQIVKAITLKVNYEYIKH
jgi:hypothetical protein